MKTKVIQIKATDESDKELMDYLQKNYQCNSIRLTMIDKGDVMRVEEFDAKL